MQPSFDFWTILFLVAAAQGLFLSVLIFSKKTKANNLLATLILLFTLCLFYYVSYWTGVDKTLPFYFSVVLGFTYLVAPLLYFYIRSDQNGIYIKFEHFIPFGTFLLYYASFRFIPEDHRALANSFQVILQNAHLIAYAIIIYNWIQNNRGTKNGALKFYQWRIQIFWSFAGYVASFLSYYILVWTGLLRVEYDYMISLTSAFFIYFVGYKGFVSPHLIDQYSKGKYQKSTLSDSASEAVLTKIKQHVAIHKVYLDSELKLQHLADQLSLSTHHISQVLNQHEGKSFSDFINEYRLKEAQSILADPNKKELKLIEVAYDTGFNNKTSFNNAFKKIIGMSPSQYRSEQHNRILS